MLAATISRIRRMMRPNEVVAAKIGIALEGNDAPFDNVPPLGDIIGPAELAHHLTDHGITVDAASLIAGDTSPIPAAADREGYHGDAHVAHWVSGHVDFDRMRGTFERHGVLLDRGRYFELGCASGRVVRHVAAFSGADVWCCDLNPRYIEWIRRYLPRRIRAFESMALPTLPIDGGVFDAVAAFSVFTHVDRFEAAWLLELRRIMRPGGIAYLTFSSEDVWKLCGKPGALRDGMLWIGRTVPKYGITEAMFEGAMPGEHLVYSWPTDAGVYNDTTFHSRNYVRREWGRFFDVVEIIPAGHNYQDVAVLRKL